MCSTCVRTCDLDSKLACVCLLLCLPIAPHVYLRKPIPRHINNENWLRFYQVKAVGVGAPEMHYLT